MTSAIGGYFSKEAVLGESIRPSALSGTILVNTGRNALKYILRSLPKVDKVYLPFYTCEVILQPLNKLGIPCEFYHINEQLELAQTIALKANEYIVINNYFGLQNQYIQRMAELYGEHLIVDNSQAFYAPTLPDIKAFYSTRKFVGVSDGGCVWLGYPKETSQSGLLHVDKSESRNAYLTIREQKGAEAGYAAFREAEESLDNQVTKVMSVETRMALGMIDYETIRVRRQQNFLYLHKALKDSNRLHLPLLLSRDDVPMVYPYWTDDSSLRQRLIDNHIYVAQYWPNVLDWCKEGSLEYEFAKNLIPLPIDQRYGEAEMKKIIEIICTSQK